MPICFHFHACVVLSIAPASCRSVAFGSMLNACIVIRKIATGPLINRANNCRRRKTEDTSPKIKKEGRSKIDSMLFDFDLDCHVKDDTSIMTSTLSMLVSQALVAH